MTTAPIQAEPTFMTKRPYRIISRVPLPIFKGLGYVGVVEKFGANNTENKRVGWHKYYATPRAFDLLCENYDVTLNQLLD